MTVTPKTGETKDYERDADIGMSDGEKCYLAIDLPSIMKLCEGKDFIKSAKKDSDKLRAITTELFTAKPLIRLLSDYEQTEGANILATDWHRIRSTALRLNDLYLQICSLESSPEVNLVIERAKEETTYRITHELKGALKEQVDNGNADFQLNRAIRSDDRTTMARKYADMKRESMVNDFLSCPNDGIPRHAESLLHDAKTVIQRLHAQNISGEFDKEIDRICSVGTAAQLLSSSLDKLSVGDEKRSRMQNLAFHLLGTSLYRPESFVGSTPSLP